jgi:IclR family transcriptional regulator, acetate operon repressor
LPDARRAHVPGRAYLVGAVDHALTLLAALRDHPSLSVKESAELLGVVPSTAHRLLTTMQANGFVVQDPATRRYAAGPALLAVALASLQRIDVGRVARPHLAALAAETRETVSLAVAEGTNVRFIDSVEGPEVVRVSSRMGVVAPAHASAAGKVMLAGTSRDELMRLYPSPRLQRRAPSSITSRATLLRELDKVRRQGFAVSQDESAAGLAAIAVGVHDVRGRVIAAIAVSVPSERFDAPRADRIAAATRRRAGRIEEELGSEHDAHPSGDGR